METVEREQIAPVVPPGQGGANGKDENVTIPKAQLEALTRSLGEAQGDAKYWAGVARTGAGAGRPAAEPPAGEDEQEIEVDESEFLDPDALTGLLDGDTPEKLVDEIAANGVEALRKRGFVTAAEAQRIAVQKATEVANRVAKSVVSTERNKNATDRQIVGNYPDLQNPESELFQETAKIYREAVAMDPNAKKSPAALMLAAKAAKTIIDARHSAQETEEERLERVEAQGGPRGRGRDTAGNDYMGPETTEILRQMGVSTDDFKVEREKLAPARTSRRGR